MNSPDTTYMDSREHLSREQLIRYQQDEMGEAEMHRAERHLLDCDLCSDALEGLSLLRPAQSEAAVQDLKGRLVARLGKEKAHSSPAYLKWAAAAAVLLLATAALWLLKGNIGDQPWGAAEIAQQEQTSREEQDPYLSFEESPDSPEIPDNSDNPDSPESSMTNRKERHRAPESEKEPGGNSPGRQTDQAESTSRRPSEAPGREMAESAPPSAKKAGEKAPSASREDYITEELLFDQEAEEDRVFGIYSREEKVEDKDRQSPVLPEVSGLQIAEKAHEKSVKSISPASSSAIRVEPPAARELKGIVKDAYGEPLPGVSVVLKGTNRGTVTDINGEYSLQLPATDVFLQMAFIGYVSQEVRVAANTMKMEAVLEEDVRTLSEVVVVGYGSQKSPNRTGAIAEVGPISPPSPAGGMRSYKKYIRENRRYPDQAREEGVEGAVVLEFYVEADGRLSDFQIHKSQGYGLDEEAIRLIKEGPAWQPATAGQTAVRHKARLRVPFKLE